MGFSIPKTQTPAEKPLSDQPAFDIDVQGLSEHSQSNLKEVPRSIPDDKTLQEVKPLCDFENYTPEWRELAEIVLKEFVPRNLGVSWNDCVGLGKSIEAIKEAVVYPMLHPQLYHGLVKPWKGNLTKLHQFIRKY